MANESAGTLSVAITGDISALLTALDQATTAATTAGTAIAEALTAPAGGTEFNLGTEITEQLQTATEAAQTAGAAIEEALSPVDTDATSAADSIEQIVTSLEAIAPEASAAADALEETATAADDVGTSATAVDDVVDSLADVAPAANDAADAIDKAAAAGDDLGTASVGAEELATSLGTTETAAESAGDAVQNAGSAAEHSGESASESGIEWGELYEKFVEIAAVLGIGLGLEELGETALEGASKVQQLTTTFTLLTGSAQTASEQIETLKDMALAVHQPFEDVAGAAQQMSVALGGFDNAVPLIKAAGDAANYMGTSFDSAASKLDRMALSGTASAKSLATLGLSTSDLAAAFNDVGNVAGATAANITKAFKALDVTDRIAVIVDAMQKMSQASEAASGNMKQQWTDFKTQFEYDMEAVGNAAEPFISTALPALTDALHDVEPVVAALAAVIGSELTNSVTIFAGAITGLSNAVSHITGPFETLVGQFTTLTAMDFSKLASVWTTMATSLGLLTGGAGQVALALNTAFSQLDNWKTSSDSAGTSTDNLSGYFDKMGQVTPTVSGYLTVLQGALVPLPSKIDSVGTSTSSLSGYFKDIGTSAPAATTGVKGVSDAAANGAPGVNDFAAALNSVTKATKTWYQEAHTGVTGLEEVEQALNTLGLSQKTINGLMLQAASDTDTSTASFTQYGTALPLTTEVTGGLGKTAAEVAAKVETLGDELYGVNVNGKATATVITEAGDASAAAATKQAQLNQAYGTGFADIQVNGKSVLDLALALDKATASAANLGAAGAKAGAGTKAAIDNARGSVIDMTGDFGNATTAIQGTGSSIIDTTGDFSNSNSVLKILGATVIDLSGDFDDVAQHAQSAADSVKDFTDALGDALDAQTSGSGAIGGNATANTLSSYLQAGATQSEVNAVAASMGLINVGQNMFDTLDQYNAIIKATGFELNNLGQLVQINASATSNNTGATNTNTTATSAAATATTGAATTLNGIQPIIVSTGAAVTALGNAAADASVATEDANTNITAAGTTLNGIQPIIVGAGTSTAALGAAANTATSATTGAASALSQLGTVAVENSAAMTSVANKTTTTYDNATDALTAFYEQVGMTTQAATALATAMTTVVHMSSAPTGTLGTTLNTAPLASQTPVENSLSMTLGPTQSGFNLYGQPISAPGYSAAPTTWTGVGSGLGNNPTQVFNVNVQSPSYQQTANQIVSALRNNASLKI